MNFRHSREANFLNKAVAQRKRERGKERKKDIKKERERESAGGRDGKMAT